MYFLFLLFLLFFFFSLYLIFSIKTRVGKHFFEILLTLFFTENVIAITRCLWHFTWTYINSKSVGQQRLDQKALYLPCRQQQIKYLGMQLLAHLTLQKKIHDCVNRTINSIR